MARRAVPKDRLRRPIGRHYVCDVELIPQNRSTLGYLALVVLLVAGLAIGLALFALQARGPLAHAEFTVAAGEGVECPVGSGAPTCFRFDVTNTGAGSGQLECIVIPEADATAVFTASGENLYLSAGPVPVEATYPMYAEVTQGPGETKVEMPAVVCQEAE
jgi:hypothetical protein